MKLAEALILRSDIQKKIEELKQRLLRSVKVQEGEKPPENPEELLKELERNLTEFTNIVMKINKTNSFTEFSKGKTISDALGERDTMAMKRTILTSVIDTASVKHDRYTRSEVKFFSTVNISKMQKQIDELAKNYRELDTKIQEKNWITELI